MNDLLKNGVMGFGDSKTIYDKPSYPTDSSIYYDEDIKEDFDNKLILRKPDYEEPNRAVKGFNFFVSDPISGGIDRIRRQGRSFGHKLNDDFELEARDLNWIQYTKLGNNDLFWVDHNMSNAKELIERAYNRPEIYENELKPRLETFFKAMPETYPDDSEIEARDKIFLYNLSVDIFEHIRDTKAYLPIAKLSHDVINKLQINDMDRLMSVGEELVELSNLIPAYQGSEHNDIRQTDVINQTLAIIGENFQDLNNEEYKKALGLLIKYIESTVPSQRANKDLMERSAKLAKNLALKYNTETDTVDKIFEEYKREGKLDEAYVFHTNAPEKITGSGLIFTTTGHKAKFENRTTGKYDEITMPDYALSGDLQISGHHIIKTREPTYLVYLAENDSNTTATIDVDNAGISSNSESSWQYKDFRGVHDNLRACLES